MHSSFRLRLLRPSLGTGSHVASDGLCAFASECECVCRFSSFLPSLSLSPSLSLLFSFFQLRLLLSTRSELLPTLTTASQEDADVPSARELHRKSNHCNAGHILHSLLLPFSRERRAPLLQPTCGSLPLESSFNSFPFQLPSLLSSTQVTGDCKPMNHSPRHVSALILVSVFTVTGRSFQDSVTHVRLP